MFKSFLIVGFFVSSVARANMTCTPTAQSKKNNETNGVVIINLSKDVKTLWISVKAAGEKSRVAIAKRDEHDSFRDKDESGNNAYNLDEDYNRIKEARYVTSDGTISVSDGDSVIF